jgi:hypothetical protein
MSKYIMACRLLAGGLSDSLQTIQKTEIGSREPESSVPVEESVRAARSDWSEEERGNVVTFFTLLDQWDRNLNKKWQVA